VWITSSNNSFRAHFKTVTKRPLISTQSSTFLFAPTTDSYHKYINAICHSSSHNICPMFRQSAIPRSLPPPGIRPTLQTHNPKVTVQPRTPNSTDRVSMFPDELVISSDLLIHLSVSYDMSLRPILAIRLLVQKTIATRIRSDRLRTA